MITNIFEENISDEWRWMRIRYYRDQLLRDSDWQMISDVPTDKVAWAHYRQLLRDLPQSVKNPMEIVFPKEPISN